MTGALGVDNPINNLNWGRQRADLEAGEIVLPGALKTFIFQVVAPSTPGSYNFQWRMLREAVGRFGAASTNLVITVPDTIPPTVASFSPAPGATNVNANANVTVTFSEAMDAATINTSTVELRDPSNNLIPATVSYDPGLHTATLDPTASLPVGVTYTARVRGGGAAPRVKDVAGNALAADATWNFTTAQSGSVALKWLVTDHLGSTRMVIDETGSLAGITRHDYAPFGEELFAGPDIRSANNGYSGDTVRQKFGSKERDIETGLDFMEARYYGSVMGRFTSVDPFDPVLGKQGANNKEEAEREFRQYLFEPARWNRYVYALNNPLKYTDPDGMNPITVNLNIIWDANAKYTDEEKERIRQTYIAQAKKSLGNIDINFKITEEDAGTASNLSNNRARIESGAREGALNVFFTREKLHAFSMTEKTNYHSGSIFLSTGGGSDPRDLTHGIIHALGVATGVNGYSNYPRAEAAVEYAQFSLSVLNRRPSYVDNRPLYEYSGYAQAKVGSPPNKYDVRSVFDVIRDGARRYHSVQRSRDY